MVTFGVPVEVAFKAKSRIHLFIYGALQSDTCKQGTVYIKYALQTVVLQDICLHDFRLPIIYIPVLSRAMLAKQETVHNSYALQAVVIEDMRLRG